MNYIEQIKGFWITHDAHSLGIEEVGLYFYLIEISNKNRWMNPFKRNNSKVMSDLGIRDRRTLDRYRNKLKQAGIIEFSTRNGDANVTYLLSDLSKNCTGYSIGSGIGSSLGSGIGDGIHNKNKTQTKPNQTSEGKPSGPKAASGKKQEKKKNLSAAAEETTEFWQAMVDTWFAFNRERVNIEPSFKGSDPRDLKNIAEILKKRAAASGHEWSEEQATSTLQVFLEHSFKDQWLQQNFLLSNLLKQFDKIVAPRNGQKSSNNRQSDLTGIKSELAAELGIGPGKS